MALATTVESRASFGHSTAAAVQQTTREELVKLTEAWMAPAHTIRAELSPLHPILTKEAP